MIWFLLILYIVIGGIFAYRAREGSVSKRDSFILGALWPVMVVVYIFSWFQN